MWKPIKDFEGYYEISINGEIRNCRSSGKGCGNIIKTKMSNWGYLSADLRKPGIRKGVCIHKVLAESFLEGGSENLVVNHKDGDKMNNSLDNLEWITKLDNYLHGRFRKGRKTKRWTANSLEYIQKVFKFSSVPGFIEFLDSDNSDKFTII